jgi:trigger factor
VSVPARPDLTDGDVYGRIEALRRQLSERTPRAEGEPIAFGDDVRLELAAFTHGERLRFGVERNLDIPLLPFEAFPGLTEALQGTPVKSSREVTLVLPPTYPVVSLRGEPTSFQVTVLAAETLRLPDVSDERFLHACGVADVDALLRRTLEVLERERADDLWMEAQERVLDELIERARVRIAPELVAAALDRACDAVESGLTGEAREEARRAWREDAASRAVIERRLEELQVLRAVAAAEGFEFDPNASAIHTAGFPGEPREDTELRARVLEYVLDRTRVEFERFGP